jgi:hypothetical protein
MYRMRGWRCSSLVELMLGMYEVHALDAGYREIKLVLNWKLPFD